MRAALLVALSAVSSLVAQEKEREEPRFKIGTAFAGGRFSFDTDGSGLDDSADAGLFRLSFEAVGRKGIGGGVRFESIVTDDDLFQGTGFASAEAFNGSIFGHFTYRIDQHRFSMPLRAGLLANALVLDQRFTVGAGDGDVEYLSFGPYFEIAPEFEVVHAKKFRWSFYGELGFGFGGTAINIDGDPRDYQSVTVFSAIEAGTRFRFGFAELGIAYLGRLQAMDESDVEFFAGNPQVALGYDSDFQGLLLSFAARF